MKSNTGFKHISKTCKEYVFQVTYYENKDKRKKVKTSKIFKKALQYRNDFLKKKDHKKYVQALEIDNEAYYLLKKKLKEITDNLK